MALIGVVGGGQLGRMMALAGYPLGQRFRFLDPSDDCPAAQVAPCIVAAYDDSEALRRFADGADAVTYEFENVPSAALDALQGLCPVRPGRVALATSQDRLAEKSYFRKRGLPTPRFAPVSTREELDAAVAAIGLPAVLKTRRFGYDGKGQEMLRSQADLDAAWSRLAGNECILEERIDFDEEISLIGVRSESGESAMYPIAHNTHRGGILRRSWCAGASEIDSPLQRKAENAALAILDDLGYVGVLALEMFVANGDIVLSEMAPRVHNSGHWSIEGADCSQFENHLRAIAGLPLGSTRCPRPCGMVNFIGNVPNVEDIVRIPGVHLHLYGKSPRPGRKLGHATVAADNADELNEALSRIESLIDPKND